MQDVHADITAQWRDCSTVVLSAADAINDGATPVGVRICGMTVHHSPTVSYLTNGLGVIDSD